LLIANCYPPPPGAQLGLAQNPLNLRRLSSPISKLRVFHQKFNIASDGAKKRMTKADLIDEVSRLAELTRKDSEVIVETIFDSIVRSLRVGDKIEIRGFGSFRTRQRKPRVGRNPKTGDRVEVPAKKIPFFKPSKELKDLVNTGAAQQPGTPPAAPATPAL
jgi:integration host factor subunit beta